MSNNKVLMYSEKNKAPQRHPDVSSGDTPAVSGDGGGGLAAAAGPGEAHLHALLVAFEEVGARIPRAVPFEELLSKPAVEALVVLALHVSASLPDAVHGDDGSCGDGDAL